MQKQVEERIGRRNVEQEEKRRTGRNDRRGG